MRINWYLVAIILFGFMIRVHHLDRDMQEDESVTVLEYSSQPYSVITTQYDNPNNHILNSIIVRSLLLLGDMKPLWLRLHVFFAGILLIPATYVMVSRIHGTTVGQITAGLVSLAGPLIDYSVNARGYSPITLLFVLLVIISQNLLTRPRLYLWLLFSVISAIGFYFLPLMTLPMGAVSLWLGSHIILDYRGQQRIRYLSYFALALLAGAALTLLLYMPILSGPGFWTLFGDRGMADPRNDEDFWGQFVAFPRDLLAYFSQGTPRIAKYVLFIFALVGGSTLPQRTRIPLWIPCVGWTLAVMFYLRFVLQLRALTWMVPVYLMLTSVGIYRLLSRRLSDRVILFGLALLLCAQVVYLRNPENLYDRTDVQDLTLEAAATAQFLATTTSSRDIILYNAQAPNALIFHMLLVGVDDPPVYVSAPPDFVFSHESVLIVNPVGDAYLSNRMLEGYGIDLDDISLSVTPITKIGEWQILELNF